MSNSLPQRVEQVQIAAQRLVRLYGLARCAVALLVTVAGLGLIDFLFRLHDPAARWLLSIAVIVAVIVAFLRLGWPVFCFHPGTVATAQHIEARFPELRERLSSAIAFATQASDDPTAGSAELRRSVIAEAEALSSGLDFFQVLDRRAAHRAAVLAGIVLAIAGLAAAANPPVVWLALSRLAQPWRELAWPRRHELAFAGPPVHVAKGQDFEVTLFDRRGTLPDDAEIVVRYATSAGWRTEIRQVRPLGERAVCRIDQVTHDFEYRARGGDDDTMPWFELSVVEPPKLVGLEVVVQPPTYTGLAPQSEGRIAKALAGSQLRIRGKVDLPIRSAVIHSSTPGMPLPAVEVAADGLQFIAPAGSDPWIVEQSGSYWFEITDEHGMDFGRDTHLEVQAIHDAPPAIAWESPIDHSFVTARAAIPVKGTIKDDLAVRGVQLRYLRPGKSDEEQTIDLFAGPDVISPGGSVRLSMTQGDLRPVNFQWELSTLAGLSPGDVLAVRITAEDYQPQLATTTVRRVTIITKEELETRIAARQAAILSQLADALRLARQCREQIQSAEDRLAQNGPSLNDRTFLQAAQHSQAQVERLLGPSAEGAEGQILALLEEIAFNRAQDLASGQRLQELIRQVRALNQDPIPAIDRELTNALKSVGELGSAADHNVQNAPCGDSTGDSPADETRGRLRRIGLHQEAVVQSLEKLVGSLTEWDNFGRIAREIGQIRADEEELANETDELKVKTVAATDMQSADRAVARRLAQRQLELGRRLDKLQTRMEEMLIRLATDDPLAAAALADAAAAARRLAVGEQMRQAASRLTQVQLGQAFETQQRVLEALRQIVESLSMRPDDELARKIHALHAAANDLHGLSSRTAHAATDLAGVAVTTPESRRQSLDRMRREIEAIGQTSQQLGRRLTRLRAQQAAASLGRAATHSSAASQAAGNGHVAEAQQQLDDLRRQLEEAHDQLVQAIAAAEQQLAHEQLAGIEQTIAGLRNRQQNVIAETQRLDARRDGGISRDYTGHSELKNLTAEQQLLANEAERLQPQLSAAAAFGFALETASTDMRRAVRLLGSGQTGAITQNAERAALTPLDQILIALRSDDDPAPPPNDPSGQQPAAEARPGGDVAATTAELKLLKLLQLSIKQRTAELDAERSRNGDTAAEQQRELDSLAHEQGRLADMVLGLIRVRDRRPEDPLDQVPGLKPPPTQKPK